MKYKIVYISSDMKLEEEMCGMVIDVVSEKYLLSSIISTYQKLLKRKYNLNERTISNLTKKVFNERNIGVYGIDAAVRILYVDEKLKLWITYHDELSNEEKIKKSDIIIDKIEVYSIMDRMLSENLSNNFYLERQDYLRELMGYTKHENICKKD